MTMNTDTINLDKMEVGKILDINMLDMVDEYDIPDEVPEWSWIEKEASYKHCRNHEEGIWEFMLNTSREFEDIPDRLKSTIEYANENDIRYILFHQGT